MFDVNLTKAKILRDAQIVIKVDQISIELQDWLLTIMISSLLSNTRGYMRYNARKLDFSMSLSIQIYFNQVIIKILMILIHFQLKIIVDSLFKFH